MLPMQLQTATCPTQNGLQKAVAVSCSCIVHDAPLGCTDCMLVYGLKGGKLFCTCWILEPASTVELA